jgi:hypothetical protein
MTIKRCWVCDEEVPPTDDGTPRGRTSRLCNDCKGDPDLRAEIADRGYSVVRAEHEHERLQRAS